MDSQCLGCVDVVVVVTLMVIYVDRPMVRSGSRLMQCVNVLALSRYSKRSQFIR